MDKETRIGQISRWLQDGYTYADIGRKLGISRQRVWQVAKEYNLSPSQIFRPIEAAQKWNCSETTIYHLIRRGLIRAERKRSRWNILTKENPRLCLVCEKPVPKGKIKYCSVKHYEARK
jgi:DNA-binding CsgD family transcriptional regulator